MSKEGLIKLYPLITVFFLFILSGCSTNSIQEVLEEDEHSSQVEILYESETEYGKVVFYKTGSTLSTYGAKVFNKDGFTWKRSLGGTVGNNNNGLDWGFGTTDDEPSFYYGIISHPEIKKVIINDTEAVIVDLDSEHNLFYLLKQGSPFKLNEDKNEIIQIKGFSCEDELLFERP